MESFSAKLSRASSSPVHFSLAVGMLLILVFSTVIMVVVKPPAEVGSSGLDSLKAVVLSVDPCPESESCDLVSFEASDGIVFSDEVYDDVGVLTPGSSVWVTRAVSDGVYSYSSVDRTLFIFLMALFFVVAAVIMGRWQGWQLLKFLV